MNQRPLPHETLGQFINRTICHQRPPHEYYEYLRRCLYGDTDPQFFEPSYVRHPVIVTHLFRK